MVSAATLGKAAFTALVDFKFEIGSALLNTSALTKQVGVLENAANSATSSLSNLGISFASSLGFGAGGVLGVLGQAVASSQELKDAQLGISQVISANAEKFTGSSKTFLERMGASRSIISDIVADAKRFGLSEGQLLQQTKLTGAALAPKGLTGTNLDVARGLGRDILKASPVLGLNPSDIEGQLLRSIEGRASMGDTLFRRLAADTDALKGMTAKAFNAKDIVKRLGLIRKAFGQFTSDGKILEERLNNIGVQTRILRNRLFGFEGILVPLGDRIRKVFVGLLKEINKIVDIQGPKIVAVFTNIFDRLDTSLTGIAENLMFFRSLKKIKDQASDTLFNIGASIGTFATLKTGFVILAKRASEAGNATKAVKFIGLAKKMGRLVPIVGAVAGSLGILGAVFEGIDNPLARFIVKWQGIASAIGIVLGIGAAVLAWMGKLKIVLGALGFILKSVLLPVILITGAFALIQRAIAIARVADAKKLPEMAARMTEVTNSIIDSVDRIIRPLWLMFDGVARLIAPIFGLENTMGPVITLMEAFVKTLRFFADVISGVGATLAGIGTFIGEFFGELNRMFTNFSFMELMTKSKPGTVLDMSVLGTSFDRGFEEFLEKAFRKPPSREEGVVTQNVTNNIDVKMSNNFKEQAEPDRVAFTIKDQILKAARSPLEANGRSLSPDAAFAR